MAPCWSCGHAAAGGAAGDHLFFCVQCGVILPAAEEAAEHRRDHLFKVLDVAPRFAVDVDALEAAMKRLQKSLHPDKFTSATDREREHSADQASLVNRAYATLRDPLSRAKYMLRGRGAGIGEDEGMGAGTEGGMRGGADALIDGALLMEVMETREAIEEAGLEQDQLRRLMAETVEKEEACIATLAAALDGESAGEGKEDVQAARRAAVKLTYLARIRKEITERL